jgi:predicted ArsR family transcriptional regulator
MAKRLITRREEEIYRLCHPDFDGLPIDQAAKKLGISREIVLRHLNSVRRKAPQLSPVLNTRQKLILALIRGGQTNSTTIASLTDIPESTVRGIIVVLEANGFVAPKSETHGYTPGCDSRVVERF